MVSKLIWVLDCKEVMCDMPLESERRPLELGAGVATPDVFGSKA